MAVLLQVLRIAATTTWRLAPYVVCGVLVGEALRYTSVGNILDRSCRRRPALAIPASAILGIVSPLCTYGTIPLVVHLLRSGVPVAPLATFLAASSLMNPQLLLMTWGGLGPAMACARLLAVFLFGILLGAILHILPPDVSVLPEVRTAQSDRHGRRRAFEWKAFVSDAYHALEFVGFYVIFGVILGSVIEVVVPGRWILAVFGGGGWRQILLAALLGVPLYACGGGTIPLVRGLIHQQMAAGAALAFLIAGPATRIQPLMALATIVRPVCVVGYVAILIAYSVLAGLLYGFL